MWKAIKRIYFEDHKVAALSRKTLRGKWKLEGRGEMFLISQLSVDVYVFTDHDHRLPSTLESRCEPGICSLVSKPVVMSGELQPDFCSPIPAARFLPPLFQMGELDALQRYMGSCLIRMSLWIHGWMILMDSLVDLNITASTALHIWLLI